jgi:hypothetical protein
MIEKVSVGLLLISLIIIIKFRARDQHAVAFLYY